MTQIMPMKMTNQEILALDGAAKGLARILAAVKFVPEFAKPVPGSPMAQAQAIDYREASRSEG